MKFVGGGKIELEVQNADPVAYCNTQGSAFCAYKLFLPAKNGIKNAPGLLSHGAANLLPQ